MGIIAIEGMQFFAHHGYYKEERILGGKFTVDVYLEINFQAAALHDELLETVNYEKVFATVKNVMEEDAHLIENVCYRILNALRSQLPAARQIRVRVNKYNPPMKGSVDKVSVEDVYIAQEL